MTATTATLNEMTIDSSITGFDRRTSTLCVEASRMEVKTPPQVVKVQSSRTKAIMTFTRFETKRDIENDITAWCYHNADKSLKLTVFND